MAGTPARKRINATEQRIVARSISGSLQQVVGSLAWGPRFGKNNDDTFVAAADGPILESVDFTATLATEAVQDLASVDFNGELGAGASIDLFSAAFDANVEARASMSMGIEISQAAPDGDLWLDEENPDTVTSGPFLNARAQSALANDRQHAYVWWDLQRFGFNDDGFESEPSDVELVFLMNHNAGVLTNPSALTYEIHAVSVEPLDEGTDTWNSGEPPSSSVIETGTVTVDNNDPTDDVLGGYRVTIPIDSASALNAFELGYEGNSSRRWLYIRFLGDVGLSQDNVQWDIVERGVTSTADDGLPRNPHLNFKAGL